MWYHGKKGFDVTLIGICLTFLQGCHYRVRRNQKFPYTPPPRGHRVTVFITSFIHSNKKDILEWQVEPNFVWLRLCCGGFGDGICAFLASAGAFVLVLH